MESKEENKTKMSVEDRLDADFLFYLSHTQPFFCNLEESQEVELCEAWLQKLCGEVVSGARAKRSRNIYLSNLILAMEEGELSGPFTTPPPKGKLTNAIQVFGPEQPQVLEEADWLDEMIGERSKDFTHRSSDGRTYVASKQLPDGRGAVGFVSITLGEKDDEVNPYTEEAEGMKDGIDNELPSEVKELLETRKPAALRNRLLRFYDNLVTSIDGELARTEPASQSVNLMLKKMESEMISYFNKKGTMCPSVRRVQMLEFLRKRTIRRRKKVYKRGKALDELEEMLKAKAHSSPHDQILFQEADSDLKPRHFLSLRQVYPDCLIERFNDLLKQEKRKILEREREKLDMFKEEVKIDQIAIITECLEKFEEARTEWQTVAEATDAVQQAVKKFRGNERAKEELRGSVEKGRRHMQSLLEELSKEQRAYEADEKENKHIRELIEEETAKIDGLVSCASKSADKNKESMANLRREINQLLCEIRAKEERAKELQRILAGQYC